MKSIIQLYFNLNKNFLVLLNFQWKYFFVNNKSETINLENNKEIMDTLYTLQMFWPARKDTIKVNLIRA